MDRLLGKSLQQNDSGTIFYLKIAVVVGNA